MYSAETMSWRAGVSVGGSLPPERSLHAAAVVGSRIYMYGGVDMFGSVLTDLFVFDTARLVRCMPGLGVFTVR